MDGHAVTFHLREVVGRRIGVSRATREEQQLIFELAAECKNNNFLKQINATKEKNRTMGRISCGSPGRGRFIHGRIEDASFDALWCPIATLIEEARVDQSAR